MKTTLRFDPLEGLLGALALTVLASWLASFVLSSTPIVEAIHQVAPPLLIAALGVAFWRLRRLRQSHAEAVRSADLRARRLRALIEHSPLAIVVLDAERKIQLINPAFEALFGWRTDEARGQSLDPLIATAEQSDDASKITRAVLAGESIHRTTRRRRKDGSLIDVEVHGVPLMVEGELAGIFALYQDVTARNQAERSLKESRERFELLSEASFEGLVVTESGLVTDCNPQVAHILGRRRGEILGQPLESFVAPSDRERMRHEMEGDRRRVDEVQMLRPDGDAITVEIRARAIRSRGRSARIAAVRDISERRRLEEQVLQNRKMEAVGRLAGGIAHDFNNILTVIAGYGQLLSIQVDRPELAGQIEEIRKATEHATAITGRLLSFSRRRPVHPVVHDVHATLRGVESMIRRLIPADIELRWRLADRELGVRADPSQIEQLVLNLAINAADAMPQGGRLTLATGVYQVAAGAFPALGEGPHVELRVEDTGSGMDPETRAHAFEPFFTTKEVGQGTGLGLATVYNIVQQNAGAIELETAPGEGTVFRVLLPLRPIEPVAPPRDVSAEGPPSLEATATILVVEDEPGVRHLAVRILELEGFEVLQAADGLLARELLRHRRDVDLVLADVVMPGVSGPEVVAEALRYSPDLAVLYMSGYSAEHLLKRFGLEIDPLIEKPFTREELVARIHQALALRVS